MKAMRLSCPGKTFLLGEYLALAGGPAILAATRPRFEMTVSAASSASTLGSVSPGQREFPFHPDSPAGLLFAKNRTSFQNHQISFHDPQQGLGGLGASSAQFLLLYAALKAWPARDSWSTVAHLNSDGVLSASRRHSVSGSESDADPFAGGRSPATPLRWQEILEDYRACAWDGEGMAPSGADLVAQTTGQITLYDGREFSAREYAWPFGDLDFTLLRTGVKLATHEHLRGRSDQIPVERLRLYLDRAHEALKEAVILDDHHASEAFCQAVRGFGEVLRETGLVYEKTQRLLTEIEVLPGVRAAKGCGAMGADIILICHDPEAGKVIRAWLPDGVSMAGTADDLSHGLEIGPA